MASSRIVDHVGRVLGGRYRLLAPIGTGASAHVFLGEDTTLRRRVAVKVLHAGLAGDESFLRRFRAEAQVVAALNHPGIMKVWDWGEDDDGPYLVLEHLARGSLRDLLDAGHLLTPAQAVAVGLEAARALDHAHRRGLVHRDIKPANLLFDEEGSLRVADFGLARALAEATWTEPGGTMLGTARYSSPEQAEGHSLDGRSDVYSLALVLVEAVTGRVPFSADTMIATLMGRIGAHLDAPAELDLLGPIVELAAAPTPDERPEAAELARHLQRAAGSLPQPAPLPLAANASPAIDGAASAPAPDDLTSLGFPARSVATTPVVTPVDPTALGGASTAERRSAAPAERGGAAPAERRSDDPTELGVAVPPATDALPAAGRHRRLPLVVWLVLAAAGAALLAIGALAALRATRPTHAVPLLVGHTEADARALVRPAHLVLRVVAHVFDEQRPVGVVVRQRPATGTLHEHDRISVDVSSGPAPRIVPDLSGLDEAGARARLEGLGLKAAFTRTPSEDVARGALLDWQPRGEQARGATITVNISDGPASRTIPDVRGRAPDDAVAALRKLGLAPVVTQVFSDTTQAGQVDGTSPGPGASAARDSKVTVNVSKGPNLVPVPNVAGQDEQQATASLQAAGLVVGNRYGPPKKSVFATDPTAGTSVRRGTTINLYTR